MLKCSENKMNALCTVSEETPGTWIIKISIKFNPFLLLKTDGNKKIFSSEESAIKHAKLLGFSDDKIKT